MDTSVSIAWVLKDQADGHAAERLFLDGYKGRCQLMAPLLWLWECGNVLQNCVRKQQIAPADIPDLLRAFRYSRIALDAAPDLAIQQSTLELAMSTGLSYYDASYVELARRQHAQLATYDDKMKTCAQAVGVDCLAL